MSRAGQKGAARPRIDVAACSVHELLPVMARSWTSYASERLSAARTSPVSDYAEVLFCNAFGWTRENNSAAGHDAKDRRGVRYQIKARRLTRFNSSRQVSAIRNLDKRPFDYLAGLLVDEKFEVIRAALVPVKIIRARSVHVGHTNSWKFLLREAIWAEKGVRDVTEQLRAAAKLL